MYNLVIEILDPFFEKTESKVEYIPNGEKISLVVSTLKEVRQISHAFRKSRCADYRMAVYRQGMILDPFEVYELCIDKPIEVIREDWNAQ